MAKKMAKVPLFTVSILGMLEGVLKWFWRGCVFWNYKVSILGMLEGVLKGLDS